MLQRCPRTIETRKNKLKQLLIGSKAYEKLKIDIRAGELNHHDLPKDIKKAEGEVESLKRELVRAKAREQDLAEKRKKLATISPNKRPAPVAAAEEKPFWPMRMAKMPTIRREIVKTPVGALKRKADISKDDEPSKKPRTTTAASIQPAVERSTNTAGTKRKAVDDLEQGGGGEKPARRRKLQNGKATTRGAGDDVAPSPPASPVRAPADAEELAQPPAPPALMWSDVGSGAPADISSSEALDIDATSDTAAGSAGKKKEKHKKQPASRVLGRDRIDINAKHVVKSRKRSLPEETDSARAVKRPKLPKSSESDDVAS